MPRLLPINRANASAETQKLLAGVEKKLGMVPNMIATIAQSPAALRAYLDFSQSLSGGSVPRRLRERIALAVSEFNGCRYCLAAHSAIGSSLGISDDDLRDARTATSQDRKTEAALQFTRRVMDERGAVLDHDVEAIRDAGYGDAEITEIIAHVALNTFTNYLNRMAQTEIDFPPVAELVSS